MISEKLSGCVVNIRSRVLAEWVVVRVGLLTIWDKPKLRHALANSLAKLFLDNVVAISDQSMEGKLKSPKSRMGELG